MSDWYYAVDNEQKGPINESELKAHFATNKLPTDTLVWKDGMDNWTAANQVPAFSFRPPPAPAKIQPTAAAPDATPVSTTVATTAPIAEKTDSTTPVDIAAIVSGKPEALDVDAEDAEKHRIFGILAYLPFLFFIPLVAAKGSPFGRYHANQGLVLFIVSFALWIVMAILDQIFVTIGLSGLAFFLGLAWLPILGLIIYGIINAAAGKCVPLPVIGGVKLIK